MFHNNVASCGVSFKNAHRLAGSLDERDTFSPMQATATFAVTAGLIAVMLSAGARAESPVALTVRLYNTAGVPDTTLVAARRAAESILRDIWPAVAFRYCGPRVALEHLLDPCDDSLKRSEVVVRFINAPAFNTTLQPDAFGVTYVVKETNRGWLATVFPDRIDQTASRVGMDRGTLLGLVMAHEVGHLLLGTRYHGATGLMVADWPDALLAREGNAWRFSAFEAAAMRQVLASIAG
jgi:hypothetical protein